MSGDLIHMMPESVAVVTGASSGIGKAIAKTLTENGWKVYGTSRKPQESSLPGVEMLVMDVTSEESVLHSINKILASSGKVDALICCAGMGVAGPVEDSSFARIEAQMETNFFGVIRCVKAVLPAMRSAQSGRILVIGSIAGRTGMPFQAFYSASKYALEGFIESLRYEMRQFGIQASILEPGDYRTGFTDARYLDEASSKGPYAPAFAATMSIQIRDERTGHDPLEAGRLVLALLSCKRMPVRKTCGPAFERFAVELKRVIPASWFEFFYRKYYRLH